MAESELTRAAQLLGRQGGLARAKQMTFAERRRLNMLRTKKRRREIARGAVNARWKRYRAMKTAA